MTNFKVPLYTSMSLNYDNIASSMSGFCLSASHIMDLSSGKKVYSFQTSFYTFSPEDNNRMIWKLKNKHYNNQIF